MDLHWYSQFTKSLTFTKSLRPRHWFLDRECRRDKSTLCRDPYVIHELRPLALLPDTGHLPSVHPKSTPGVSDVIPFPTRRPFPVCPGGGPRVPTLGLGEETGETPPSCSSCILLTGSERWTPVSLLDLRDRLGLAPWHRRTTDLYTDPPHRTVP